MTSSCNRANFNNIQVITLVLLFFAGMNIDSKYYYFCFIGTLIFILLQKKIILDSNVVLLFIFSFSWVFFSPDLDENFAITTLIKPFLYPMAYIVGRNFFISDRKKEPLEITERSVLNTIVIIAFGPFLHYLINYINNFGSTRRNTIDVWSGEILSATNQAALACMMIAVAIALLFIETKRITKYFSTIVLIIIIMYNLVLSGRTLFVLMAVTGFVCSCFCLRENKSFSRKFKMITVILGTIVAVYFIISFNIFGVKDYLESSNIYYRFLNKGSVDIFSSGRLKLKILHLQNFESSIFGGENIRRSGIGYAHDLFLDTFDEAGILALITIATFSIRCIYVLHKCINRKTIGIRFRIMILALYVSIFLEFLIEPIIQGVPWLFTLFCFIHGIIEFVYLESKKKSNHLFVTS